MSILKPIEDAPGFLKAGILGFAGSGKTFTATQLAVGARKALNLTGPIGYFDTENGTPFVQGYVRAATGQPLVGVKSRSLGDLKLTVKECIASGVSVLIVDSITHVWREVCDTYLARLNESRVLDRKPKLDRLDFQHWSAIKGPDMWAGWTDLFLNAPLHIIVCGRAGYEYDFQDRDDGSGKKDLIKTGIKMKVEGEFGFEPSIVVEMSADQVMEGGNVVDVVHTALVLKDRTMDPAVSLTGRSKEFRRTDPDTAVFDFFAPHVTSLRPSGHQPVDTSRRTEMQTPESMAAWDREKRARTSAIEEADGLLEAAGFAGTSGEAKSMRAKLALECFGITSRTKMESTPSAALREGLDKLRVRLAEIADAKKEDAK